jgi:UDP-GlcNAc3NAcA epimerase
VLTGDVMYDACVAFRSLAETRGGPMAERWTTGEFALATVHRAENTDDPARLRDILTALDCIARTICPVVWPIHPRTKARLEAMGWKAGAVDIIEPISYLGMLLLESRARLILTDSGGVQKEAYFLQTPCVTLRDETEWEETLENNCNVLTGCDRQKILAAAKQTSHAGPWSVHYGDGRAAEIMVNALCGDSLA